jgi:hypothetical protein
LLIDSRPQLLNPARPDGSTWDPVDPVAGPVRAKLKTGLRKKPVKPDRPGGLTRDPGKTRHIYTLTFLCATGSKTKVEQLIN